MDSIYDSTSRIGAGLQLLVDQFHSGQKQLIDACSEPKKTRNLYSFAMEIEATRQELQTIAAALEPLS